MTEEKKKQVCGLVMPISAIDGLSEAHWLEVLEILTDSIKKGGFTANLVSNANDVGIIHKRIIQNLYDNPIVVVDVSAKNPNVMFELGMRLAFDKPTIIVKDDKTSYSFDTGQIEHLGYPRDLRFAQITEFKEKLTDKIRATHEKATNDPNYTTFLKNFGEFTVAKLDKKEVSGQEYILEELKVLRRSVESLRVPRMPPFGKQLIGDDTTETVGLPTITIGGLGSVKHRDRLRQLVDEEAKKTGISGAKTLGDQAMIILSSEITPGRANDIMDALRAAGFSELQFSR